MASNTRSATVIASEGELSVIPPPPLHYLILRDPRCSVILEGKEISRLHARVKREQREVQLESLSETSRVRLFPVSVWRLEAVLTMFVITGSMVSWSSMEEVELTLVLEIS